MPIREARPHRIKFFDHVRTSADIPTADGDAWELNPKHRWVYDKLAIAETQGIAAGPHGTKPPCFPVFSKPITNLRGMGTGSRVFHTRTEYEANFTAGHMWTTLAEGQHISSDVAVVDGEPRWWRHVTSKPAGEGTFDYWTVRAEPMPAIEAASGAWVRRHLVGYTGMLNLETIGGTIIEAHLRFAAQWPDLYGTGWVDALAHLYERGQWHFEDADRRDGYSVVLFVPFGRQHSHPSPEVLADVEGLTGVTSVQITFKENEILASHAMPIGGYRVAIVNGFDLSAALDGRERLRQHMMPDSMASVLDSSSAGAASISSFVAA